ncbi:MAG: winged helix DNA-binding domain-containing protein [Actinomycetota bacterium]|nr:winged helix DNA-binding domain-containing protein [Actinomycetota bacterium]
MPTELTNRALNRALLARQGLLEPWDCSVIEAIERLIALQAQAPMAPYFGLRSRLAGFVPKELSTLLLDRRVVRIALMRSTLQLVSARDCLALRPILQADLVRVLPPQLRNRVDLAEIVERARELVDERPVTFAELGRTLAGHFPDVSPDDLSRIARNSLALVQITPRGVWGSAMTATHSSAESWLGRPLDSNSCPDELILRYLRAFGPATVADIAAWSGMAGLRPQLERLRPRLRSFVNPRGQELLDVVDGLLPAADQPVPVRIIAEFDNLLLAHADRDRIFAGADRMRFISVNGLVSSTFLIDGFVAGTCKLSRSKGTATVTFRPFTKLRKVDRAALQVEGARLIDFGAADADRTEVVIEAADL